MSTYNFTVDNTCWKTYCDGKGYPTLCPSRSCEARLLSNRGTQHIDCNLSHVVVFMQIEHTKVFLLENHSSVPGEYVDRRERFWVVSE